MTHPKAPSGLPMIELHSGSCRSLKKYIPSSTSVSSGFLTQYEVNRWPVAVLNEMLQHLFDINQKAMSVKKWKGQKLKTRFTMTTRCFVESSLL